MTKSEVKELLTGLIDWNVEKEIDGIMKKFKKKELAPHKEFLYGMVDELKLKSPSEAIYLIMHDMEEPPKCIDCHQQYTKFLSYVRGYKPRCPKCGSLHSTEACHEAMRNKTAEEKKAISDKIQSRIQEKKDQVLNESADAWKRLTRKDVKDYIISLINNKDSDKKRGISNHILYERPDVYNYIKNEVERLGYSDDDKGGSMVLYMILHDMEEVPKCKVCGTRNVAYYFLDGKYQFSDKCQHCGQARI